MCYGQEHYSQNLRFITQQWLGGIQHKERYGIISFSTNGQAVRSRSEKCQVTAHIVQKQIGAVRERTQNLNSAIYVVSPTTVWVKQEVVPGRWFRFYPASLMSTQNLWWLSTRKTEQHSQMLWEDRETNTVLYSCSLRFTNSTAKHKNHFNLAGGLTYFRGQFFITIQACGKLKFLLLTLHDKNWSFVSYCLGWFNIIDRPGNGTKKWEVC